MAGSSIVLTVQIYDTDCYGVMWHGAYSKWLEQARVKWLLDRGIDLSRPPYDPQSRACLFPVVSQQLAFKAPAYFGDVLTFVTTGHREGRCRLVFEQHVQKQGVDSDRVTTTLVATTVCTVVDERWRPMRQLPSAIADAFGDNVS
ncbi:MAG: acyl-CoA thioesterase [Vampirovibrionales bacterium]|nr:acyl-CoA thioesterase [Vampirovibrionales bacterium]